MVRDPQVVVGAFGWIGMIRTRPDEPRFCWMPIRSPVHGFTAGKRDITTSISPHGMDLQHIFFKPIGAIGNPLAIG